MYRTPHFSAITKRILCLILLPTSSDAGGVQVCTHFEEDTESQARHASGTYYDSLYGTFEFVLFQLYVLKLLKMQTKYLGRQWRKSNMKTMSAIYTKVSQQWSCKFLNMFAKYFLSTNITKLLFSSFYQNPR